MNEALASPGKTPSRAQGMQKAAPRSVAERGGTTGPARITLLYESRDGKYCLFQDGTGHLTSVRASRLA